MKFFSVISNQLAPLTLLGAVVAYFYPPSFLIFKDVFLWLFAATMFCLGLVLQTSELQEVARNPRQVGLGVAAQYSIMPLLGFSAAMIAPLSPEMALGLIIVACAPGAMASNVIVFLAGGALAYSIAVTTVATVLSPLLTPWLVKTLGGAIMPIALWPMMQTILLTVLLPLLLGMLLRKLLKEKVDVASQIAPAVAVIAIVVICSYAIAANAGRLAEVGLSIFIAVVFINLCGYIAGWNLAKWFRFDHKKQIALTIEIGMQNAGLGVALALKHFGAQAALPGALFAVWCVLTAAGFSAYTRRKLSIQRRQ